MADQTCQACDGTGLVDVDSWDRRGEHVSRTVECPDCADADRYCAVEALDADDVEQLGEVRDEADESLIHLLRLMAP